MYPNRLTYVVLFFNALCCLVTAPIFAEQTLIPRVEFYSNDNAWDAQINANASFYAYEAPYQNKPSIWLIGIQDHDKTKNAKPLMLGDKFRFRYFKWSLHPDYLLIFADNSGDERWRLYSLNIKTNALTPLSPGEGQRAQLVGFDYDNVGEIIVAHNKRVPEYNDVYRVNVSTGQEKLIYQNDSQYADFYVSNSGKLTLANKRDPETDDFTLERPKGLLHPTDKAQPLFHVPFEDNRSFRFLQFSQDEQFFYVLSAANRDTAALLKVSYKTGEYETIARSDKADIKEVIFDPTTQTPLLYAIDYTSREWVAIENNKAALAEKLSHDFKGRVDIVSTSITGNYSTIYISGKAASYYALLNHQTAETRRLVNAYPQLAKYSFSEKVAFTMKTRDGKTQTGTFVAAHGSDKDQDGYPDTPTPMIIMAHGGPWDQSRPGFDTWQQWLANRGYSVISPNFRASTGLGKDWLNQGNREWGGVIQNDIVDAVNWAIEMGYAQKDKIGSMGASFGGYVSLRLLTDTPDLLACGVSTSASPNLISLYNALPEYWAAFKREYLIRVGDATTEAGRALLKSHSPLFYADNITKPLLIFHGEHDSRVDISEPQQIVDAMLKNKQDVTFAVSKQSGHGSADPDAELAYQAIVEKFFAKCLGGRYERFNAELPQESIEIRAGGAFFLEP
ncbi:alpha/beta hydrolase family protein [Alteromonas facilis]|uniref:alpha/beta hydrolase family protein n=1 Tax=Alteromonas facilis TaxID=2048004 RepID=UPI000C28B3F3|nr:prolyl oligopeptidase family serine peptidase [Alteromonas facilis]